MREAKRNNATVVHTNSMQDDHALRTQDLSGTDEELVDQFKNGNEDAFRLIVQRYEKKVRSIIYFTLNNNALVDDVAQEVFLKVYQGLPKFRYEAKLYTWLYKITINKCRDVIRRERVKKIIPFARFESKDEQNIQGELTTDMNVNGSEQVVEQALQKLPARFREIIVLKDLEEYTYEEIAEILQCEMGTVKSRLSRARSKLRDILEPYLKEDL